MRLKYFSVQPEKHVIPTMPARKCHISLDALLLSCLDTCDTCNILEYFCNTLYKRSKPHIAQYKCGCDNFWYIGKTCDTYGSAYTAVLVSQG